MQNLESYQENKRKELEELLEQAALHRTFPRVHLTGMIFQTRPSVATS
jgi:hypothetical protein